MKHNNVKLIVNCIFKEIIIKTKENLSFFK